MPKIQDTTNDEILEVVKNFASATEERFENIESEIGGIKDKIGGIKNEIGKVKNRMVTKDYLDEKMADLWGDLVVMMRKEDTKVKTLVDILEKRKIISKEDVQKIISMEPFARLS